MPTQSWKIWLVTRIRGVKLWEIFLVAVTLVGIVICIIAAPAPWNTIGCIALGFCVAVTLAIWAFRKQAKPSPFQVVLTTQRAEVENAFHFGAETYRRIGKADWYPPLELVLEWWERYHDGVFRLCDRHDELWGYVSIWPIAEPAFEALKAGTVTEGDLTGASIQKHGTGPFHYWYIADVCKKKKPPKFPAEFSEYTTVFMIAESLLQMAKMEALANSVEMLAIAATAPGERLLRKFGFMKIGLPDKDKKIFVRSLDKKKIPELAGSLLDELSRHESMVRDLLAGLTQKLP
jgi:hypothetical protein